MVTRNQYPSIETNTPFVINTHILRFLGVKHYEGISETEILGDLIIRAGFTNYVDLLLEGIIPLRINGIPLKTELRMGALK